jgi:organic hydroperoxide reductase OsmC/OhrA
MSTHLAQIVWQKAAGESFTDGHYSRRHQLRFDGGAVVAGSSSPAVVPVPYSDPGAVDPEELFVAALASCHMLWFLSLAAQAGWRVERYVDEATGTLVRQAQGRAAIDKVTLHPRVEFSGPRQPTAAEIEDLHDQAHDSCFIASSVITQVLCEPRY